MSPSRYFDVQVEGPVTVVRFREKQLNDSNVLQIAQELAGLADQLGQGELHLDFTDVQYLSTVVMAKLLTLHKRVTQEGGRFVLTNLDELYELFSVTHLNRHLEIRRKAADDDQPPSDLPGAGVPPP